MPSRHLPLLRAVPGLIAAATLAATASAHPGHGLDIPHLHEAQAAPAPHDHQHDGHDHHHGHDHAPAVPPALLEATPMADRARALPPGVVAQINGANITRAGLLSTLEQLGGQPLLSQLVRAEIVNQEAARLGVVVTDEEVAEEVREARENIVGQMMMQGTPMTFEEAALRMGISEGLLEWSTRQQLVMQRAYERTVEQEIPPFENQIHASHILIATIPLGDPEAQPLTDEAAKERIDTILTEIRAGRTTFEEAAREHSHDTASGARGGELGWFPRGVMDPAFEAAAFALQTPHELSPPVKTQFGWHIIRLDRTGASLTAEEQQELRAVEVARATQNPQGIRAWMADLVNKADVVTNPAALRATADAPRTEP